MLAVANSAVKQPYILWFTCKQFPNLNKKQKARMKMDSKWIFVVAVLALKTGPVETN